MMIHACGNIPIVASLAREMYEQWIASQSKAVEARRVHYPKAVGSSPTPKRRKDGLFYNSCA
ncbi:hypothetical protein M1N50_02525 [Dehalococcoidia bacterium]|nr:hypothetical protein [Dehalococcoidia bacterium]